MKKNIDKAIKQRPNEVNLSTFSFLFAEIINYYLQKNKDKFEENIQQLGSTLGPRIYEYIIARDKTYKKENNYEEITRIIHSSVWTTLFGKTADSLKKIGNDTYVIYDNNPLYLKYIPKREGKDYTYAYFVGGIIKGILDYAGFEAEVDTQTPPNDGKSQYPVTGFVITFSSEVINRKIVKN